MLPNICFSTNNSPNQGAKQTKRQFAKTKFGNTMPLFAQTLLLVIILTGGAFQTEAQSGGCPTPSFAPAVFYPTGNDPLSVTVGDFNGDGELDLLTLNFFTNYISVLLGDGKGGFTAGPNILVGYEALALASGDFNRDGKLDIALTYTTFLGISILLGNGAG